MKIGHTGTKTEIIGEVGETHQFKMNNSPIAFDILSSRLYNDKILAIIRELSCNAYDAHVAAGKAHIPFHIQLPNTFEPVFKITDFGTGLSDKGVRDLYCTYFASDKSDSNEMIGAMGLGSKSPFCYTTKDTDEPIGFTVTSRFEGWVRTYDAHIGESGLPEVTLMSEQEQADAINGLEIAIPVVKSDFTEFANKAEKVFEFFDPVPVVDGQINYQPQVAEYIVKTDKWALRVNDRYYSSGRKLYVGDGIRAVMGRVAYQIGKIDISKMTESQQTIMDMPLDLFFEIGELTPAASREVLSNTRQTIDALLRAIQYVHDDLLSEIFENVNKCSNIWDAYNTIREMKGGPLGPLVTETITDKSIFRQYTNFKLENMKELQFNEHDYNHIHVVKFVYSSFAENRAKKHHLFMDRNSREWKNRLESLDKKWSTLEQYRQSVSTNPETLFVINDLAEGGHRYINYVIQQKQPIDGYLKRAVNVYCIQPVVKSLILPADFHTECENFLTKIGNPKVITASDLKSMFPDADPAKVVKAYQPRETGKVLFLDWGGTSFEKMWFKEDIASLPKTEKIYVLLKDFKPVFLEDKPTLEVWSSADNFTTFMLKVKDSKIFGFKNEQLYGLKPSSKLIGTEGWTPLAVHLKREAEKLLIPYEYEKLHFLLSDPMIGRPDAFKYIFNSKDLTFDSPIKRFSEAYTLANTHKDKYSLVYVLGTLKKFGLIDYSIDKFRDLKTWYKQIANIYPLFSHLSEYIPGDLYVHYIKLVDEANENKLKALELAKLATYAAQPIDDDEREALSVN